VKIGASEIVKNLNFSGRDGLPLIPRGALLYVSTDDPEGLCTGCMAQRKPCSEFSSPKPEGCPEDVSMMKLLLRVDMTFVFVDKLECI
jgi:hypothetical protein